MNKKNLSLHQRLLVAATLFGMFFGAGNLIFPVHLGQLAGRNLIPAMAGFIIAAVGIPILGLQPLEIHILTGCRHFLPGLADVTVTFSPVCFI